MAVHHDQDCSNLTHEELMHINLAMSITGGIGVLIAGTILMGLICAKAYKTILQRLFLYTVLSALVQEASHVANIEHQFNYTESLQEKMCAGIGFISNWSSWILYIFYLVVILYLLVVVRMQITEGSYLIQIKRFKFLKVLLEVGTVVASVFGPVLILWVPYRDKQYGYDEGYCLIKSFKRDSCAKGAVFLYFFSYTFSLYEVVGCITVVIASGLTIVYCTLSARLQRASLMTRHLVFLLLVIIVNLVLMNLMLVVESNTHVGYGYRIFLAIFATLDDMIYLIAYLLAFYSSALNNLMKKPLKIKKKEAVLNRPNATKDYGTFNVSSRITAPSNTYFDVQHTGEFTTITE